MAKNILRIVVLISIIVGFIISCIYDKVKKEAINGITKDSRKVIDVIATVVTAIPYIAITLYRYEIAKTSNMVCYILGTVVIFNLFIRLLNFSNIFCSNKVIAIMLLLIIEYILNIFIFLYTPAIAALIVLYALFLIAGQSSSSSHRENGGLDFLDGVFLGYFLSLKKDHSYHYDKNGLFLSFRIENIAKSHSLSHWMRYNVIASRSIVHIFINLTDA